MELGGSHTACIAVCTVRGVVARLVYDVANMEACFAKSLHCRFNSGLVRSNVSSKPSRSYRTPDTIASQNWTSAHIFGLTPSPPQCRQGRLREGENQAIPPP